MKVWIDIIGWAGSLGVVAAYALNSYKVIASDSWIFLVLNLIGGVFLIIYSFYYAAFANTFINVVWVVIAVTAMLRLLYTRKSG